MSIEIIANVDEKEVFPSVLSHTYRDHQNKESLDYGIEDIGYLIDKEVSDKRFILIHEAEARHGFRKTDNDRLYEFNEKDLPALKEFLAKD